MVKYEARKPVNTKESGRGVMFGGRWMDTFIDKLAHKLTAQEMIKANSAADAAELQRTKSQLAKYEELLRELKEVGRLNAESAKQVRDLAAESVARVEDTQRVTALIDETLVKIQQIQSTQMDMEAIGAKLEELKPLFEQLSEHVHKENVKVYRNVQAVVEEETAKVTEQVDKRIGSVSGRVTAVLTISIVALLASVAGLVFQILVYLNIL